jgi:hypothetical protein
MRPFWMPLLLVVLYAIDRAYMGGQNAAHVVALAHWFQHLI